MNIRCVKVSLHCGKVLSRPLAIRIAQLLQGNEPLHSARDVALVSFRTSRAIVGGVLGCEIPCGGVRYVGSGLLKYDGMRCECEYREDR